MSERNSLDDWQLEGSGQAGDQWQLLDQEQSLPEDMRLRETGAPPAQWTPVAYAEDEGGGRGGWILPTLIIIALLAVMGYIGWLAMNGFEIGLPTNQATPTALPDDTSGEPGVVAVSDATADTADDAAAAPTAEPATATPPPEPTEAPTATPATVVQRVVTVISLYGVNARLEPGDGDVATVLETGTTGVVIDESGEWVRIELDSGEQYWVSNSAELVEFTTRTVVVEEGATPPVGSEATAVPTAAEATDAATPAATEAATDADGVTARIDSAVGLNARSEPSTDGEVVMIVPEGTELPVTAVSDDGEWVEVTLEDGRSGWLTVEFVTITGDLAGLEQGAVEPTPEPATATEPITGTTALTDTTTVTGTSTVTDTQPQPDVDPMVSIDNLLGATARSAPDTGADSIATLARGTELPALGRSTDDEWVQVELEDGTEAWLFAGAVSLNVEIGTLPIVEP
ncbi:MAG: SH3 domain-containing protein [Caldilineaceae bacterium]|nr:SH3 domain-containing protein [Caldilineaceae bacterium]